MQKAMMVHKSLNGLTPKYLSELLVNWIFTEELREQTCCPNAPHQLFEKYAA